MKMTVKEHLINFLDWHLVNKRIFRTHKIQNLSERGIEKYGKRLGSPESYRVIKVDSKGSEQAWIVTGKDDR